VVTSGDGALEGQEVVMAEQHKHQYHFMREPDVLAMTVKALDCPDYVPERIVEVHVCTCGELHDIEWMAGGLSTSIPDWMARRFRATSTARRWGSGCGE
jgi:hypothetical protein